MCIGLDTINVKMIKKVIAAPILPKADRRGDKVRSAIKIPIVISMAPVIPENILVLTNLKAQEKKGLFSASGRMASASCLVNFNIPIQIKVTTIAYLNAKVQEKKERSAAAVFIIREFGFLNFRESFVFYLLHLFVNFPAACSFFAYDIK